jgi:hypothetical protein
MEIIQKNQGCNDYINRRKRFIIVTKTLLTKNVIR